MRRQLAAGADGGEALNPPAAPAAPAPGHPAIARLRQGPLDLHAHVAPEAFLARLGGRSGFGVETEGGRRRLVIGGKAMRMPMLPAMADLDERLAAMEEQGIAAELVSPWIALVDDTLGETDGDWFFPVLNEGILRFCADTPERFAGIGAVPLTRPERAARMLEEIVAAGLLGVEINTALGPDRFLDDPALDPFWAAAEATGALVMIHPSLGGLSPPYARYYLNNLIHNPLETTFAAAHLIFGGVMERFPGLKVLLVHGGGLLPYDLGRLRRGHAVRAETKISLRGSVDDSFRRFYFDSVTHSPSALRFLVGEAAAGHVVMGTDYPFDMADPDPVGTVRRAGVGEAAEASVLRGAADAMF